MSSFPNSPRLQRGALVGLDPANPLASVIVSHRNASLQKNEKPEITSGSRL